MQISVEEGLEPWQENLWADQLKEAEEMDLLNASILKGSSAELIKSKSRWHMALITAFPERDF